MNKNRIATKKLLLLSSACLTGILAGCNNSNNQTTESPPPPIPRFNSPTQSSSIALTSNDARLVVANRQKGTVSIIQVRDQGADTQSLLAEIPVGNEPRYVAITPDDSKALVSNTVDGTVSVIDLHTFSVLSTISVGTEPRGIAMTPTGAFAFVANHTSASVSVVRMADSQVINTIATGGNPQAIAITNNGDDNDADEQVYVTRFFSEVIDPQNRPDGFDDSKQGIVNQFGVAEAIVGNTSVSTIRIPPMASGFTADRRSFCANTRQILQDSGTVFFNSGADKTGNGAAALANTTFCPDNESIDASAEGAIAKTPQMVYPNSLNAALIRGQQLYILNVGAQPEPPVKFNVNIQPLVNVIDIAQGAISALSVNLNDQIKAETQPTETAGSLVRAFGNDVVAMTANTAGNDFLIVSRGGNYVLRAGLDANNKLTINAPNVIRYQTGNIPSGIVMSLDGTRAYTNNEVNTSVTAIDLQANQVLIRDINSSTPPELGTQKHRQLVGKLAFYTALGIPDVHDTNADGSFDIAIRDIVPVQFRNKASDNGWSGCVSCHEDGHSDNVTWIFPTGPRQTIPLEGSFAKNNPNDQRIFNWNAVQGGVTDFNNNSRGIQGGIGHATDVNGVNRTAEIYNHGPTKGISDALDAMSEWIATIRSPIMPKLQDQAILTSGTNTFGAFCASCHGGTKWSKSQTSPLYLNNPTFAEDPLGASFFSGVLPIDSRLVIAGPQIRQLKDTLGTLTFIDNVGTYKGSNRLEIRGTGAIAGQSTQGFASLGGIGFNSPSLLGVAYSSPYLHDGSAITLRDVFSVHQLPALENSPTIAAALNESDLASLEQFLLTIDDSTATMPSDSDQFIQAAGL